MIVTLIEAEDCHLCHDAHAILDRLTSEGCPMDITVLDWTDHAAKPLLQRDGVPFPPALYVDGELWAYGRVSERAIRKRLAKRGFTNPS
ncbi:hypothetical protein EPN52_14970 [bacterium]|nr:MAG: hypothetical protein EPN52_14970 [bacterium]